MNDLVKRLRTCKPEERRDLAVQAAQSDNSEGVEEVLRMIEGHRRHLLARYNLEDQLTGIEALGRSGREEFIPYLQRLMKSTYTEESSRYSSTSSDSWLDDTHEATRKYDYPHVKGKLRGRLRHTEHSSTPFMDQENTDVTTSKRKDYEHHTEFGQYSFCVRFEEIVRTAIGQLQRSWC